MRKADRRRFVKECTGSLLSAGIWTSTLPNTAQAAETGVPIAEPHFPSPMHLFIWRNWELVNTGRIAAVLATGENEILRLGASMGLPEKKELTSEQLHYLELTTLRQNWYVLPNDQLLELLGWNERRLKETLETEDFLLIKLGLFKPQCPRIVYQLESAMTRRAVSRIRELTSKVLESAEGTDEPPVHFRKQFLSGRVPSLSQKNNVSPAVWGSNFIYPFLAPYKDPFLEDPSEFLPERYLEELNQLGIGGIWLPGLLRDLIPESILPGVGSSDDVRLTGLVRTVERAAEFGVDLFLYLNEPRSMPAAYFDNSPELRGAADPLIPGNFALCTTQKFVREWIADSLFSLFGAVPRLKGILCISMSENQTHCYSRINPSPCPRCPGRSREDVLVELLNAINDGVSRSGQTAEVLFWDWGWDLQPFRVDAQTVIPRLPAGSRLVSVSEWGETATRGDVTATVREYSISVPGPGPRARRNWASAFEKGIESLAKVQIGNTWEIAAVPYIPVPPLILDHLSRLTSYPLSGLMMSWTLGCFPSPNLEAACTFLADPGLEFEVILSRVAERRFGVPAASAVVNAWYIFSEAFREYPVGINLYRVPIQHGPANLLRLSPTGLAASLILFPHDDLDGWRGAYTPQKLREQLDLLASKWLPGVKILKDALTNSDGAPQMEISRELGVAEVCYLHFRSVANQVRFYELRRGLLRGGGEVNEILTGIEETAADEMQLAERLFTLSKADSRIGFESSNHYFYRPLDLLEKILNCDDVIRRIQLVKSSPRLSSAYQGGRRTG